MQIILLIKRILRKAGRLRLLLFTTVFATSLLQAQTVTLKVHNAPLKKVFSQIKKQTGYSFMYASEFLENTKPVSISVNKAPLTEVLELCFKDQPLSYTINDNFIVLRKKEATPVRNLVSIRGRIVNEKGEGIEGATIVLKGKSTGTSTNEKGVFSLEEVDENAVLLISSIGYQSQEVALNGRRFVSIQLNIESKLLDETIIKGYYTTSKRFNTGNVSRVTKEDIQKQPVSNVLQALQGRAAGLVITQTNGLAGSAMNVQIRGRSSIAQGSNPLYVIDGVPLDAGNETLSQLFSALNANAGIRGVSAFGLLNPADVESIEILKDADATSIYGSRGANGVILITTKKGKEGSTKFNLNFYSGFSQLTRTMDLLNTKQYLEMRREAFANDNSQPTVNSAYDLILWDTTRYTDFKKMLIGGKAAATDAQASVSGGSLQTQFLIGGGYHRETTVFPGEFGSSRASTHFSINHATDNRKLSIGLVGYYAYNLNTVTSIDLTSIINVVPNLPELQDSTGALSWNHKGINFVNPLSFLRREYRASSDLLNANLQLNYNLLNNLSLTTNFGYNTTQIEERSLSPVTAQNPALNPTGSAGFAHAVASGWVIEPQVKYSFLVGKGRVQLLAGSSFQKNNSKRTLINANGYTNDQLLRDVNAAASVSVTDDHTQYKYQGLFGRINYNLKEKYILNLTGRRDGSSRFGTGRQFSNFGAVGAAWIFTNESFLKKNAHFLSYGKLRLSYGTSGNDQIGDYKYLAAWTATRFPYQTSSGLYPVNLFNPDYSWEVNHKWEAGLELGLWKEQLYVSASFFRNRSGNQLINYQLPNQTGFFDITQNFPALVQNKGVEIEVVSKNLQSNFLRWSTSLNLTIPKNELLAFPGIENSSYSYLALGQPLSVYNGYYFLGVDPVTGIYSFSDKDGKPTSSPTSSDLVKSLGHLEPTYYGGMLNSFGYKTFSLDVFVEFKKQKGANYLSFLTSNVPGTITNQFVNVWERWQKPDDLSPIQKFTQSPASAASQAASVFRLFDNNGKYSDASYVRLKNISVSYSLPGTTLHKLHLANCRFYLQGQNLVTLTRYIGTDPETRNISSLPPLKTFTAGIQLGF